MRTNQGNCFRKYLLTALLAVFILGGSAFSYFYYANSAPDPSCPSLQAGDVVRLDGDSYWYWLDSNRNLVVIASHLLNSWGKVTSPKIINTKCFDSLDVSTKKVNYRPGTYLLKYHKSNQLYAVLPGNKFAKISTTTANQLYGTHNPVSLNGFWWMNIINKTTEITNNTPHSGLLISPDGKKTIYYVDETNKLHLVTANGFTTNGFNKTFVRNISSSVIDQMTKAGTIDQALAHLLDKTQETAPSYPAVIIPTPTSTYSLTASATSVNEGSTVTFTLTTTNVTNSPNLPYTISGISSSDLSSGSLTGNFQISNNKATQTFTLANDVTTEGAETMLLSLTNGQANVRVAVNDTSLTPTLPPAPTSSPYGTTYYIRTDGGDATQCSGKTDAAYPGTGANQACAWKHPFIALPPGESSRPTARIQGGDTLVIANGSYKMGAGAPGATGCITGNGSFDCVIANIPSGPSANKPTRILGANYNNGCAIKPELWGSGRPWALFQLNNGAANIEWQCLDLTDHSSCIEHHSNSAVACQRDGNNPGDWASNGIRANDRTTNIKIKNLDIHGFASTGLQTSRMTDWTLENVNIRGNGIAGWNADYNGTYALGTITMRRVNIEWNGCGETYPKKQFANCWGQTAGGYGDGFGAGDTGGNWLIEDSSFLHNTSDGLDLLYVRQPNSLVTVRRGHFEGNAGNQLKVSGQSIITDNIIISNCGYFSGKPFTYNVDHCRALGGAVVFEMSNNNSTANFYNNTVYSDGDTILAASNYNSTGPYTVNAYNNILYGGNDFHQPGDLSAFFWRSTDQIRFNNGYNILYHYKDGENYCGASSSTNHNMCGFDPKLTKVSTDSFDLKTRSDSPAIDRGTIALTNLDYLRNSRPQGAGVDIGAYEIK